MHYIVTTLNFEINLKSIKFIYITQFSVPQHDPSYTGEIHLIPSALRSEAPAGPASTTVRENVGSPDEDCFCHYLCKRFAHLLMFFMPFNFI